MQPASTVNTQQQSQVKKYSADELVYKCIGHKGNGYLIDCYKDGNLLMTYIGYYNYKTDEYTLYPYTQNRFDSRIPGKHIISNRKLIRI